MGYPIQMSFIDYSYCFLPVQALNANVIEEAFKFDRLFEDVENDSICNDLSKTIVFQEEESLKNTAEIKLVNGDYQITFYLPFAQFLWSVGLYLTTYFDNCVQIPMMNAMGCISQGVTVDNMALAFAGDTFFRARQLLYGVKKEAYTQVPNIYDPQIFKEEIEKANGVYIGAQIFAFAHEFSHNFLGHTHIENDYSRSVQDEMDADAQAMDYISDGFDDEEWGDTYKVGIVILLCALLLLGDDTISGGGSHPHMDVRINTLINKLDIPKSDIIWGLAGSAIRLWLLVYGGLEIAEDRQFPGVAYYKEFYERYLGLLREYREKKFPDLVKSVWDI